MPLNNVTLFFAAEARVIDENGISLNEKGR